MTELLKIHPEFITIIIAVITQIIWFIDCLYSTRMDLKRYEFEMDTIIGITRKIKKENSLSEMILRKEMINLLNKTAHEMNVLSGNTVSALVEAFTDKNTRIVPVVRDSISNNKLNVNIDIDKMYKDLLELPKDRQIHTEESSLILPIHTGDMNGGSKISGFLCYYSPGRNVFKNEQIINLASGARDSISSMVEKEFNKYNFPTL